MSVTTAATVRRDRKDIHQDTKDIHQDRREVRQDLKSGDTTEART